MSEIQAELLKATDLKAKKKEERREFLHRLVDAVQDLDDDDWKGLSTEAQKWVNEAASAIKEDGEDAEIDEFPDLEDATEEEGTEASTDNEEESDVADNGKEDKAPSKKKKVVKAEPAKTEKKVTAKPEKKAASGPKATGIKVLIKKLVLKKPTISVEELLDKLGKDGTKPSKLTVSAIRSEFRHSLFVLRDAGALKGEFDLG